MSHFVKSKHVSLLHPVSSYRHYNVLWSRGMYLITEDVTLICKCIKGCYI